MPSTGRDIHLIYKKNFDGKLALYENLALYNKVKNDLHSLCLYSNRLFNVHYYTSSTDELTVGVI